MATVRYFWHGFIHRLQHFCTFSIVSPLIYHLLQSVWKASYTISASIFFDVPYWPPYSMDKFISCVVPGPSQWFSHIGEEIVIAWTHIGWVRWMFQNLPSQYKNLQEGQLGIFRGPNSQCACHKISGSTSAPHQAVLHSNSAVTISYVLS